MEHTNASLGSDEHLEISCSEEATQALEQVLSGGLPVLYRHAYRLLGNRADAGDAVQDALLAACTHLAQFKRQSQMSSWVLLLVLAIMSSAWRAGAEDAEFVHVHQDENAPKSNQKELVYEGFVSIGNIRLFGAAENAKLYASGVELDRELWPHLLHTRVDAVCEVLPVVLLTQPQRTDIWGNTLSRSRKIVPGAGITPIGFRLLWRDGKPVMPYFEVKGSVLGFTQKALSAEATYENWSFHLTQGVKVHLRGRYDLRVGVLSDLHFSNAFVVRSNPAVDLMNVELGLVYRLGKPRERVAAR
jgi:hypothetical protein